MGKNRSRSTVITAVLISLAVQCARGELTGASVAKTDGKWLALSNSLPSRIITTDKMTYDAVRLLRVEPDGLVVEFRPPAGGTGLAKLKFARLPEPIQRQFGYDPMEAETYESDQAEVMTSLARKLRQDDQLRAVASTTMARPNLSRFVTVNHSDPTVTYKYYGPGPIPDEVGTNNVGVLYHHFTCHSDFDLHWKQTAPGQPIHFYIDAATISLGLSCTIIQPDHPWERGRVHEEGHRKISEYFYGFAPKVARRLGESMIDREFVSTATDFEAARAQILSEAGHAVEREYLMQLDEVAKAANRYYDQTTDHARNNMTFDPVQDAIAKFGANFSN